MGVFKNRSTVYKHCRNIKFHIIHITYSFQYLAKSKKITVSLPVDIFVTITEDCRWEKKIKGDREIKILHCIFSTCMQRMSSDCRLILFPGTMNSQNCSPIQPSRDVKLELPHHKNTDFNNTFH